MRVQTKPLMLSVERLARVAESGLTVHVERELGSARIVRLEGEYEDVRALLDELWLPADVRPVA